MEDKLLGNNSKFYFIDENTGEKTPLEEVKTLIDEDYYSIEEANVIMAEHDCVGFSMYNLGNESNTNQEESQKAELEEEEKPKQKPNPVFVPKHVAHRKKRW